MLDLAAIPDGDFQRGREGRWIQRAVAAPSPSGWPRGSLGTPKALPFWPVQAERCLGFSLYFAANVVPGAVAMLLPLALALRLWALLRFVGAPVGPGGRTAVAQPPRGVVCLVLRLRPIQQSHGRGPSRPSISRPWLPDTACGLGMCMLPMPHVVSRRLYVICTPLECRYFNAKADVESVRRNQFNFCERHTQKHVHL